jgi:hypothetical protein
MTDWEEIIRRAERMREVCNYKYETSPKAYAEISSFVEWLKKQSLGKHDEDKIGVE